ncbi:MAG: hypothetical protein Alpg2KO_16470 [Alphaproteobacteria bacterium]
MTQTSPPTEAQQPSKQGPGRLKIFVIVIAAIATVGLLTSYASSKSMHDKASAEMKVTKTINSIIALQGRIALLYSNKSSYGTQEMTAEVISAGIAPAHMVVGHGPNASLKNEWGGRFMIFPTGQGSGFRLSMEDVPRDACVSLLTKMAGSSSQNSLLGISVQSKVAPTDSYPVLRQPIDSGKAQSACADEQNNGISVYYR